MLKEREKRIQLWFEMWLQQKDLGIAQIFAEEVIYIESWGPQYSNRKILKHWFEEWNQRGKVLSWTIKQYFHYGNQTVVEWCFKDKMDNGKVEAFDGMSLIEWTETNQIIFLKEFGCKQNHYNPYEKGDEPQFRDGKVAWL
ncbi:nuclear transport factor 2 family protein [Pasteurella oralis]|uniref:Nuclear transport factor 2 family protein n=1 Tax=Pasteurella oralis TaxID=1071947 RepID=A0ABW4NS52_9PAST|nr:nuclear transport factor 2 family protein [Pasteurella oralis]MDO5054682.1 nuclear transport factor 2 family protein [Pasteurella oralis]